MSVNISVSVTLMSTGGSSGSRGFEQPAATMRLSRRVAPNRRASEWFIDYLQNQ